MDACLQELRKLSFQKNLQWAKKLFQWETMGQSDLNSPIFKNPGRKLPFLAIETDGNAFPQIIEARIEAFSLQAKRLHEKMMAERH